MKKVVKFGGSSLASAEQFEKVGKIGKQFVGRTIDVEPHVNLFYEKDDAVLVQSFLRDNLSVLVHRQKNARIDVDHKVVRRADGRRHGLTLAEKKNERQNNHEQRRAGNERKNGGFTP